MRRNDAGYSLVFALAVMAAFSILVAAMLGLSSSVSVQTLKAGEVQRGRAAADSSVEFGIDRVATDGAAASVLAQTTYSVPGTVDGETVDVTVKNVSVTYITICFPGESAPCPANLDGTPRTFMGTINTPHDFSAYVRSLGTQIPFSPVWSVSPSADATISQAGRFVATASGTYTVKIEVNNVFATVMVSVPIVSVP